MSKVLCSNGYTLDPVLGRYCIDIDECANGTHECTADQTCENRIGGYVCSCPSGHVVGPNKDCIDIDECSLYGNICGSNSRCENTVGSFKCNCENGFEHVNSFAGNSCQVSCTLLLLILPFEKFDLSIKSFFTYLLLKSVNK